MPDVNPQRLLLDALAHHQAGRLEQAESIYRQILSRDPNNADAMGFLGVIAFQCGQHQIAETLLRRATILAPANAIHHNNLGEPLRAQGKLREAAAAYQRAVKVQEGYADAHLNLAVVLSALGDLATARKHIDRCIELDPRRADARNNLGLLLHSTGQLTAAAEAFGASIALNDSGLTYGNRGQTLVELRRFDEAEVSFRKALELNANDVCAHSNLLLSMHYHVDDPQKVYAEHVRWAAAHEGPLRSLWPNHAERRVARERLRVGYVSADFRAHPVAEFIEPLIGGHHRDQFEVFCYANVVAADAVTARLAKRADVWRNVVGVSDAQLAAQIMGDRIDILVDLSGHTGGNRLLAFARKPAPIQVAYLGYPSTTGMSAMDYRLTDAIADPVGLTDDFYSEKLVRLDGPFLCYRPPSGAPTVSTAPCLQSGQITFGSFNNFTKVTDEVLATWAEMLRRVRGSRLIIKSKAMADGPVRERVVRRFAELGIEASRIELVQQMSYEEHLTLYGRVDIALDSFPYCGTTTTCEALWMGAPVVTLSGRTHVSRVGASILTHAGLAELIAGDREGYIALAVKLAVERERVAELRKGMRERMAGSGLCDEKGFVERVEGAYRGM